MPINGPVNPVCEIPTYSGEEYLPLRLPRRASCWSHGKNFSLGEAQGNTGSLMGAVESITRAEGWQWPERKVFFFSDLHADADAFIASLVASGGVSKTGASLLDFELTQVGETAAFIVGGDTFDKGPSNLNLLRVLHRLQAIGAGVELLAGNHDVRLLLGMRSAGSAQCPRSGHFFVRMGVKVIPLLVEIWNHYLKDDPQALARIPNNDRCRQLLIPNEEWYTRFPDAAADCLSKAAIERERVRVRKKSRQLEQGCAEAGLSLRQVYAITQRWHRLFLDADGEFSWFYRQLRLMHRIGSFLFLHAGVDDKIAQVIQEQGTSAVNEMFAQALQQDPLAFYYGPVGNCIRTKYRDQDQPLTVEGTRRIRRAGIGAVVHGHRNRLSGQRLVLRHDLLNFECDTTLDRKSRDSEGLQGLGAGVTIIDPRGLVMGISTDYPDIKVFEPNALLNSVATAH